MEEKGPITAGHRDSDAVLPAADVEQGVQQSQLVAAPSAAFPGSFAAKGRSAEGVFVKKRRGGRKGVLRLYLTDGWDDVAIWKSAFIEFVATMCLCYLSGLLFITIGSYGITQVGVYVGITNIFLLSLFIYAVSPGSGGHINPFITFTTMLAGLTGFARGILYMTAQTMGAALAGGLIRGSFGEALTQKYQGGGCFFLPSALSQSQALLIEIINSFMLAFLAFGVGLDPRQSALFGPLTGPFLVSCVIALLTFAGTGLAPGYQGPQMNPARCFAYAVARGEFVHQWIWWAGPALAGVFHAAVYYIAPPYHWEVKTTRLESS